MYDFAELYHLKIKRVRHRSCGRFATLVSATACSDQPSRCTQCGGPLRGHGRKITTYRDLPCRDAGVAIMVERLRFRCAHCGTTTLQPVAEMDQRFRMTDRLVDRIRFEALSRPFTVIAVECGIHEKTVRRIIRDRVPRLTARAANTRKAD